MWRRSWSVIHNIDQTPSRCLTIQTWLQSKFAFSHCRNLRLLLEEYNVQSGPCGKEKRERQPKPLGARGHSILRSHVHSGGQGLGGSLQESGFCLSCLLPADGRASLSITESEDPLYLSDVFSTVVSVEVGNHGVFFHIYKPVCLICSKSRKIFKALKLLVTPAIPHLGVVFQQWGKKHTKMFAKVIYFLNMENGQQPNFPN